MSRSRCFTLSALFMLAFALALAMVMACAASSTATPSPSPTNPSTADPTSAPEPTETPSSEQPTSEATPEPATSTAAPSPTSAPEPSPSPAATIPPREIPGIVDPTYHSWPRSVEGLNGVFEIPEKPQRIIAISAGHTEILAALVEVERIVGLGTYAFQEDFSSIVDIAEQVGTVVDRDAESVIALDPDMVIDSAFSDPGLVEQLEQAGITVVQTNDDTTIAGKIDTIHLMAYILGEEERGERLAQQVEQRLQFVTETLGDIPEDEKPGVILLGYLSKWTGGVGTSYEDVITRAGGINLPSQEFEDWQEIGDEAVVAMNPDVLLLTSAEVRDNNAMSVFLNNPALTEVEAVKNEEVYGVEGKYIGNLSHWGVRGIEEVARILHPDKFEGVEFPPFESVLE